MQPRERVDDRTVRGRVHPRHAQHARLRGARDSHAGRRHRPHRRLQDRPDADRRRSTSTCTASPSSAAQGVLALFADSTNIDRRGFTGSELEVDRSVRGDLHQRHRQADRRGVRLEHLSHADPGRPRGAVRSQSRVRRPRHDARTPRSRSGSATCAFRPACRFATPRSATTRPRTCSAWRPVRRASRCRRCRASRSTITVT